MVDNQLGYLNSNHAPRVAPISQATIASSVNGLQRELESSAAEWHPNAHMSEEIALEHFGHRE